MQISEEWENSAENAKEREPEEAVGPVETKKPVVEAESPATVEMEVIARGNDIVYNNIEEQAGSNE